MRRTLDWVQLERPRSASTRRGLRLRSLPALTDSPGVTRLLALRVKLKRWQTIAPLHGHTPDFDVPTILCRAATVAEDPARVRPSYPSNQQRSRDK